VLPTPPKEQEVGMSQSVRDTRGRCGDREVGYPGICSW